MVGYEYIRQRQRIRRWARAGYIICWMPWGKAPSLEQSNLPPEAVVLQPDARLIDTAFGVCRSADLLPFY